MSFFISLFHSLISIVVAQLYIATGNLQPLHTYQCLLLDSLTTEWKWNLSAP